jgi:hypothetical protein
MGQFY